MIKANLPESYGWKGQIYEQGDREIPDDLAIALGLLPPTLEEPGTPDLPGTPMHDSPFVVELINSATTPKELTPLPGIGEGAAKRLLVHRPEAGYESLQQLVELCPELQKAPYRVDWGAILAYSGDANEQPD